MSEKTLWIGPLAAAIVGLIAFQGMSFEASFTLAIAIICVVWWAFEPVPIPVTSCLPIAALPLFGVLPMSEVSQSYGSSLILLLLGGFILSTALANSGAHERLAMAMVRLFGGQSSKRLVFGFMAASALLSMWISNTATTLMLLPVAIAVLARSKDQKLTIPLLLGIAYAASVGGIGTPIGTPPNLIFMQVYSDYGNAEMTFLQWMQYAVPVVLILVPCMALWLTRSLDYQGRTEIPEAGPWRSIEKRVVTVFLLTALFWVTRKAPYGGWSSWLDLPAHDSHVALLAVIVMFLIPDGEKKGQRLLNWEVASKIPWGVLLLFAGGITLAAAFKATGISAQVGEALGGATAWPALLLVLTIALGITFLTELTSNTATTSLIMPILAATAIHANLNPLLLMVPAAMSASCAFMLPVATAPNAVVYSTGSLTTGDMVREGLVLNLIGATVITLICVILISA